MLTQSYQSALLPQFQSSHLPRFQHTFPAIHEVTVVVPCVPRGSVATVPVAKLTVPLVPEHSILEVPES